MLCATDHTTKLNTAAPAAGVVVADAFTGMWIGLATEFTSKPALAVRRRR